MDCIQFSHAIAVILCVREFSHVCDLCVCVKATYTVYWLIHCVMLSLCVLDTFSAPMFVFVCINVVWLCNFVCY